MVPPQIWLCTRGQGGYCVWGDTHIIFFTSIFHIKVHTYCKTVYSYIKYTSDVCTARRETNPRRCDWVTRTSRKPSSFPTTLDPCACTVVWNPDVAAPVAEQTCIRLADLSRDATHWQQFPQSCLTLFTHKASVKTDAKSRVHP